MVSTATSFGRFVRSFFEEIDAITEKESTFAKRVATGLAAERYFESVQPSLEDFRFYTVEDTTRLGVGYDFRLLSPTVEAFLAVEVKGLTERTGAITLTTKEFEMAGLLADRFLLFVVRNFREKPFHEIYRNPLASSLHFSRRERIVVDASWSANLI